MELLQFKQILEQRGIMDILEDLKKGNAELYEVIERLIESAKNKKKPSGADQRTLFGDMKGLWGLTYLDVSDIDLSRFSKEQLLRISFSNLTKWPSKDKLPKGFEPIKEIETAKHFRGFGIDQLHQKGVDGRGVVIAYIDKPFNVNHEEFEGLDLDYTPEREVEFHGTSVSSRVVGKNMGIAPKSKYIFFEKVDDLTEDSLESNIIGTINALKKIIERVEAGERIDVVGESASPLSLMDRMMGKGGENAKKVETFKREYLALTKRLEELNVAYVTSDSFWNNGFGYAFKVDPAKDINDIDNYISMSAECVCVPEGGRCVPCAFDNSNYKYENQVGCASWSIPQIVGLFALVRQVDNSITYDKFVDFAHKTATEPNQYGVRFINASELMKSVKREKIDNNDLK